MQYQGMAMAQAPPRKSHLKLIAMGLGALAVVGVILYFLKKKSSTPSGSQMDTVNAATSGTPAVVAAALPQVSASVAGAAALTADSGGTATGTGSFSPITAVPSVATSGSTPAVASVATSVATSATTVAAPTVAASAPTVSPLFIAYKNTSVTGPIKSGLCVDAGGPFDSAALYWCLGSNSQAWNRDPTSGQVQVQSTNNCLASSDPTGASGAQVTTKACDKTDASQLWDWASGAFQLRGTSQCADSTVLGNGARMSMAPCNAGTPTQTWSN